MTIQALDSCETGSLIMIELFGDPEVSWFQPRYSGWLNGGGVMALTNHDDCGGNAA